jgi:hypothetical protein
VCKRCRTQCRPIEAHITEDEKVILTYVCFKCKAEWVEDITPPYWVGPFKDKAPKKGEDQPEHSGVDEPPGD